jgi:hypothetical protein
MWKNIAEDGRSQMAVWHMRIACWILKATNTHSEYVIIIALPLQKWLIEEPQCYVTRILPVLFIITNFLNMFFAPYTWTCCQSDPSI